MWAWLLEAVAHAQDAATVATGATGAVEAVAPGTIGDYTGPVSIVVAVVYGLDKAGMLRIGRSDSAPIEAPTHAQDASIAALDARVHTAETAITRLERRADTAQTERARHEERIGGLRGEFDGHVSECRTQRNADRTELADRLDRLADRLAPPR